MVLLTGDGLIVELSFQLSEVTAIVSSKWNVIISVSVSADVLMRF